MILLAAYVAIVCLANDRTQCEKIGDPYETAEACKADVNKLKEFWREHMDEEIPDPVHCEDEKGKEV
jgi:hypothetical protein